MPAIFQPDAPRDLSDLAARLLSFNPSARPSGKELLDKLGRRISTNRPALTRSSVAASNLFVGRESELAVLAEKRLPGVLASVPTAREQGYDIVWPVIRGVWMGPGVPDADYRRWVDAFARMQATPDFAQLRTQAGLYPFSLTGDALTRWVKQAIDDYNRQAREFNLVREH